MVLDHCESDPATSTHYEGAYWTYLRKKVEELLTIVEKTKCRGNALKS